MLPLSLCLSLLLPGLTVADSIHIPLTRRSRDEYNPERLAAIANHLRGKYGIGPSQTQRRGVEDIPMINQVRSSLVCWTSNVYSCTAALRRQLFGNCRNRNTVSVGFLAEMMSESLHRHCPWAPFTGRT
jgi:hypothetical protein